MVQVVEVGLFFGEGTTLNFPSLSGRNSVAPYGSVVSVNPCFVASSLIKENTGAENDFVL